MSDEFAPEHPHFDKGIPAVLDQNGCCLVCAALSAPEMLALEIERLHQEIDAQNDYIDSLEEQIPMGQGGGSLKDLRQYASTSKTTEQKQYEADLEKAHEEMIELRTVLDNFPKTEWILNEDFKWEEHPELNKPVDEAPLDTTEGESYVEQVENLSDTLRAEIILMDRERLELEEKHDQELDELYDRIVQLETAIKHHDDLKWIESHNEEEEEVHLFNSIEEFWDAFGIEHEPDDEREGSFDGEDESTDEGSPYGHLAPSHSHALEGDFSEEEEQPGCVYGINVTFPNMVSSYETGSNSGSVISHFYETPRVIWRHVDGDDAPSKTLKPRNGSSWGRLSKRFWPFSKKDLTES